MTATAMEAATDAPTTMVLHCISCAFVTEHGLLGLLGLLIKAHIFMYPCSSQDVSGRRARPHKQPDHGLNNMKSLAGGLFTRGEIDAVTGLPKVFRARPKSGIRSINSIFSLFLTNSRSLARSSSSCWIPSCWIPSPNSSTTHPTPHTSQIADDSISTIARATGQIGGRRRDAAG